MPDASALPMSYARPKATNRLEPLGDLVAAPGRVSTRPAHRQASKDAPLLSLLETRFPALAISLVAAADRRAKDPSYAAHRWWARRPPSLMRAILLAAAVGDGTTDREFWAHYRSDAPLLAGLRVHDPFMGGGTTLMEASRLGAAVSGTDVDPTAQVIVSHSLEPARESELVEAGDALMAFLRSHFSALYPDDDGEPLHSFWIAIVTCPGCGATGPLYRSTVLARDCDKPGAVVRDDRATVFDPDTLELRYLRSATQKQFRGSRRRWAVDHSTFHASKYQCPSCGKRSAHRELQTGTAPLRLVAVERTPTGGRRKLLKPGPRDLAAVDLASELLKYPPVPLRLPDVDFDPVRRDPRPRSFGIVAVRDLFTPRRLTGTIPPEWARLRSLGSLGSLRIRPNQVRGCLPAGLPEESPELRTFFEPCAGTRR